MFGLAVLVGGAFGARHAFEPDHIAAVATLVSEEPRPATTGAAWGVGHSAPIVLIGGLFLLLDIRLPAVVATAFEAVVAAMLVGLGLNVLSGRRTVGAAVLGWARRQHDRADGSHWHLPMGGRRVGLTHLHTTDTSVAVGIVHGLAGSGGVVVALAAAAPTLTGGAGFLLGFSVASVVSMSCASWIWRHGIGQYDRLRLVTGIASVAVGLLLGAELAGITLAA